MNFPYPRPRVVIACVIAASGAFFVSWSHTRGFATIAPIDRVPAHEYEVFAPLVVALLATSPIIFIGAVVPTEAMFAFGKTHAALTVAMLLVGGVRSEQEGLDWTAVILLIGSAFDACFVGFPWLMSVRGKDGPAWLFTSLTTALFLGWKLGQIA